MASYDASSDDEEWIVGGGGGDVVGVEGQGVHYDSLAEDVDGSVEGAARDLWELGYGGGDDDAEEYEVEDVEFTQDQQGSGLTRMEVSNARFFGVKWHKLYYKQQLRDTAARRVMAAAAAQAGRANCAIWDDTSASQKPLADMDNTFSQPSGRSLVQAHAHAFSRRKLAKTAVLRMLQRTTGPASRQLPIADSNLLARELEDIAHVVHVCGRDIKWVLKKGRVARGFRPEGDVDAATYAEANIEGEERMVEMAQGTEAVAKVVENERKEGGVWWGGAVVEQAVQEVAPGLKRGGGGYSVGGLGTAHVQHEFKHGLVQQCKNDFLTLRLAKQFLMQRVWQEGELRSLGSGGVVGMVEMDEEAAQKVVEGVGRIGQVVYEEGGIVGQALYEQYEVLMGLDRVLEEDLKGEGQVDDESTEQEVARGVTQGDDELPEMPDGWGVQGNLEGHARNTVVDLEGGDEVSEPVTEQLSNDQQAVYTELEGDVDRWKSQAPAFSPTQPIQSQSAPTAAQLEQLSDDAGDDFEFIDDMEIYDVAESSKARSVSVVSENTLTESESNDSAAAYADLELSDDVAISPRPRPQQRPPRQYPTTSADVSSRGMPQPGTAALDMKPRATEATSHPLFSQSTSEPPSPTSSPANPTSSTSPAPSPRQHVLDAYGLVPEDLAGKSIAWEQMPRGGQTAVQERRAAQQSLEQFYQFKVKPRPSRPPVPPRRPGLVPRVSTPVTNAQNSKPPPTSTFEAGATSDAEVEVVRDGGEQKGGKRVETRVNVLGGKGKKLSVKLGVDERLFDFMSTSELRKLASDVASPDPNKATTKDPRKLHRQLIITGGEKARHRLLSLTGANTRPMMKRVREAVFNIAHSVSASPYEMPAGSTWLDLYAGTGAVGLDALSRGCEHAHFVELDPKVVQQVLQPNITGYTPRGTIHTARAEDYLMRAKTIRGFVPKPFDYVSVCPPYLSVSYPELFRLLTNSPVLHDRSVVFVEYPRELSLQIPATLNKLVMQKERVYGRTLLAVYVPMEGT